MPLAWEELEDLSGTYPCFFLRISFGVDSPVHTDEQQLAIVEHDHPWTLPRGNIIGRSIVIQRFELLADMSAQRVGIVAPRLRLLKSAAHCNALVGVSLSSSANVRGKTPILGCSRRSLKLASYRPPLSQFRAHHFFTKQSGSISKVIEF